MNKAKKKYFEGLNELRAIAALGVVVHHIEQIKGIESVSQFGASFNYLIHNLGKSSVNLFFVLSGFLITVLLLQEKEINKKIDISKFYFRRIFRIWPLYYLIMIISFIIIPILSHLSFFSVLDGLLPSINNPENYNLKTISLYSFFLPQFANVVVGASQSWSIGVEEQFYLIIPLIVSFFYGKWFFRSLLLVLIVFSISTLLYYEVFGMENFIYKVFKYFKIEFLTIGAIGGYIYFIKSDIIKEFTKAKFLYVLIISIVFFLMGFRVFDHKLQEFILGLLFILLILFSINDDNKLVFRNRIFSYLGKISYGIYMYHVFIIFFIFPFFKRQFLDFIGAPIVLNISLYLSVFICTIVISILSYEFFELKFIRIKDKKYKTF